MINDDVGDLVNLSLFSLQTRIYLGMTTLKELIVKRPCMKMEFLDILLNFTSHEKVEVTAECSLSNKTI